MSRIRSSAINAAAAQRLAEQVVTVVLSETETDTLLSLPSLVLSTEVRESKEVEESNKAYEAIIEAHKNSDGFTARPTQTINNPQKNQNEMAAPNASQEVSCQATAYDIADSVQGNQGQQTDEYSLLQGGEAGETEVDTGLSPHVAKFVESTVKMSLNTPGCLLDALQVTTTNPGQKGGKSGKHSDSGDRRSRANNGPLSSSAAMVNGSQAFFGTDVVGGSAADQSNGSGHHSGSNPNNLSGQHTGEEGDTFDCDDRVFVGHDSMKSLEEANLEAVLSSSTLVKKLQMVERAVQQNAYHRHILDYRDFPDVQPLTLVAEMEKATVVDSVDKLFGGTGLTSALARGASPAAAIGGSTTLESDGVGTSAGNRKGNLGSAHDVSAGASAGEDGALGSSGHLVQGSSHVGDTDHAAKVRKLFTYSAPSLVRSRPVTCMSWNSENTDILAVGYGKVDFIPENSHPKGPNGEELTEEELASGLVLFWSLRNPDYPEKVLRTPHAITALDFSKRNPTLLAVGFYNGDIAVYDVRREVDWEKPMETSAGMAGSHSDPVWQVKWLAKGQDRTETLVSISTDGNVLQWSLKKGLLVSLLMQLKRGGAGEGWISRQASGLCFDFAPEDHGTYVTGTEEGTVHRCSISYNEQYLETYEGHSGPVYRLKYSPWWGEIFLSCSADWTMSLYHMRSNWPLLTFHSSGEDFSINDISWCPRNSTVFAAVTADAKFQIWDISVSDIDPVISLDTNADVDAGGDTAENHKSATSAGSSHAGLTSSRKGTGAATQNSRRDYGNRGEAQRDDDKETPVTRLLKNLASGASSRRTLTTVTFSENSPVAVVGDSKGVITVYRVNEPNIMTDISNPVAQTMKLKEAVWRQIDPSDAAKLQNNSSNTSGVENSNNPVNNDKPQPSPVVKDQSPSGESNTANQ
eukprot:CAMPEP_0185032610 /NCGR_PEP_ID=MMETSP1103-20130426/20814_1 /TAXON_ID=36769 /ORGANISM="Paraphysomonas bandaiensis, Strain Caron Lab Isolate" /LENGTH=917 /DNA_ID=CAMNT_0027568567 /DNA_START=408 /DNA_END=3161 /DNA_ORIENTATION=-